MSWDLIMGRLKVYLGKLSLVCLPLTSFIHFPFYPLVTCNRRLAFVSSCISHTSRTYKRTVSFFIVRRPFNFIWRYVDTTPASQGLLSHGARGINRVRPPVHRHEPGSAHQSEFWTYTWGRPNCWGLIELRLGLFSTRPTWVGVSRAWLQLQNSSTP